MNEDIVNVPAIAITTTYVVDEGRQMSFQTGVAQDIGAADLNALLDKLEMAALRQQALVKTRSLERKIEDGLKTLILREEDLVRLDEEAKARYNASGKKMPFSFDRMLPRDKQVRDQVIEVRERYKKMILDDQKQLEYYRGLLNGAATSAANSGNGVQDRAGA
jgi:hypothetical protein